MKKILFIAGITMMISLGIFALSSNIKRSDIISEKISIITTLFPQYDFAKAIGGDKVDVTLLLPPGIEAHAYEPKPSDIAKINSAKIFVYTGEFMEPWAHDIIKSAGKNVEVVDASIGIKMIQEKNEYEQKEISRHEPEKKYDRNGGVDPHIWLDFDNAKTMAKNIAQALARIDPKNAEYYQNNLQSYQDKLTQLDNSYRDTLSSCKTKTIIHGGHYTFGYLAKRYDLEYVSAQGFSPDSEPTAKDMIALTEQIKKNNIQYIFSEELVNPKITETLARETNAKLLLLNGAHNLTKEDYESDATFISLMENNLKNLSLGLNCQE